MLEVYFPEPFTRLCLKIFSIFDLKFASSIAYPQQKIAARQSQIPVNIDVMTRVAK